MTEKFTKAVKLINELAKEHDGMRPFGRFIGEDCADISRWCAGKNAIGVRAIIKICRLFPRIKPHELNADVFPEDLEFTFKRKKQ